MHIELTFFKFTSLWKDMLKLYNKNNSKICKLGILKKLIKIFYILKCIKYNFYEDIKNNYLPLIQNYSSNRK